MASSSIISSWFAVRQELSPTRKKIIGLASFLLPLLIWCIVSYVPFIWHPMVIIENPGDVDYFQVEMLVDKATFNEEFNAMQRGGKAQPQGYPANPIYLPAPHAVAKALYTAFVNAPGFKSLYGSSKIADDFNVKYAVYKTPQDLSKAIDPLFNK